MEFSIDWKNSNTKEILFHNGYQPREDSRLLRNVGRFWLNLLLFLDLFCPVFPKDTIYKYSFETKTIIKLPINRRSLGMQYWCDLYDGVFISRHSNYLGDKKTNILFHKKLSWAPIDIVEVNDKIICPRFFKGQIFVLDKDLLEIFELQSGQLLHKVGSAWFDFFSWQGQDYLISGRDIFKIQRDDSGGLYLCPAAQLDLSDVYGEGTICSHEGKITLILRKFGENFSALGSSLVLFESNDMIGWTAGETLQLTRQWWSFPFDGVGFPILREADGELVLYFTGYWGWHLLLPYTRKVWKL